MLQQDQADDYVIATGETHSVEELVSCAFDRVGLDPTEYVHVDETLRRGKAQLHDLVGDPDEGARAARLGADRGLRRARRAARGRRPRACPGRGARRPRPRGASARLTLHRLLAPRVLLAAGAVVALLAVAIAGAERLSPRFLDLTERLTLPWAVLLVVAAAVLLSLGPGRRVGAAIRAVPAPAALAVVVALGTAVQVVRGAGTTLPVILGDELIYSGVAKSVGLDGALRFRGDLHLGHSVLHPVVLGPFFAAVDAVDALLAIKVVQALLMALAAVPAYLLARRVSSHGWSLAVAAFTALAPWAGYATLLTTEALFFPVFVTLAWAVAGMLERPTRGRQAATLVLATAAALVKPQAFVLLPAIAAAIGLFVATSKPRPPLRRYGLVLGGLGAMTAAAAVILLGSRNAPGGAYGALLDEVPRVREVLEWTVWHVGVFAVALGVVALMAFPVALARLLGRGATPAERSLGATAAALSAFVLVSVDGALGEPVRLGILHERSLFFLTPLVLACLAHWLEHGRRGAGPSRPSRPGPSSPRSSCSRAVPRAPNGFDYPALTPFTSRVWLVGVAVVAAAVFLVVRRSVAPIASVAIAFVALAGAASWPDHVSTAEARRLAWVDGALPGSARALLVHVDLPPVNDDACGRRPWFEQQALGVWTEFFNTRVDRVAHVYADNEAGGVPSTELIVASGGVLETDGGRTLAPRYVVLDSRQAVAGTRLRRFDLDPAVPFYRDGASLSLWRAEAPLRLAPRPEPLPPRADGTPCPG